MAEFNQTLGESQVMDQSRASEGFRDDALGSLFSNVAESFQLGVRATDDFLKRRVADDARAMVEPLRDAAIAEVAGYDAPQPKLPEEANNEFRRLGLVRQGVRAGRLSDSYYRSQLDVVSKKLRRSYPGYEDEIDNNLQNLTGSIPANKLLANLQAEASQAMSDLGEGSKDARRIYQKAVEEGEIDSRLRPFESFSSVQDINDAAAPKRLLKAQLSQTQSSLSVAKASEELDAGRAVKQISGDAYKLTTDLLGDVSGTFGKTFKELSDKIATLPKDQPWTAEEQKYLTTQTDTLRQGLRVKLNNYMLTPLGDSTYGATIGAEAGEKIINDQLTRLDSMMGSIRNKETGVFTHNAAIVAAQKDGDSSRLSMDESIREYEAIRTRLGDTVANSYLSSNPKLLGNIGVLAHDAITMGVAGGKYDSLSKAVEAVNDPSVSKEVKAKVGPEIIGTLNKAINDPKVPFEVKARTIMSMYGPNNERFITRNVAMYREMTKPENLQSIYKLSKESNAPELWNSVQNWTLKTNATILFNQKESLQGGIVNRKFVTANYDPATHMASVVPRDRVTEQSNVQGTQKFLVDTVENQILEPQLRSAVNIFNQTVQSVNAVFKAENPATAAQNTNEWVKTVTTMYGVDFGATKQEPGMSSFFGMLNSAVDKYLPAPAIPLFRVNEDRTISLNVAKGPNGELIRREAPPQIGVRGSQGTDRQGGGEGNDRLTTPRGAPTGEITEEAQAYATQGIDVLTGIPSFMSAIESGDAKEIAKQALLAAATILPFPGGKIAAKALDAAVDTARSADVVLLEGAKIAKELDAGPKFTKVTLTPDDLAAGATFSSKVAEQAGYAGKSELVISQIGGLVDRGVPVGAISKYREKGSKYVIFDPVDNKIVDGATDLKSAITKVNNRDNQYGATRYRHIKIDD